jgi:hypothetical protein
MSASTASDTITSPPHADDYGRDFTRNVELATGRSCL